MRLKDGRRVALKFVFLANPVLTTEEQVATLRREAAVMHRLDHPNIVRIAASYENKEHQIILIDQGMCAGNDLLVELVSNINQAATLITESLLRCIIEQLLDVRPLPAPCP